MNLSLNKWAAIFLTAVAVSFGQLRISPRTLVMLALLAIMIMATMAGYPIMGPEVMGVAVVGEISAAEVKRLIEDQGTAWHEYRKTNDERITKLEKGEATAELEAKLDKIDKDLETKTAEWEEILKKLQRPKIEVADEKKMAEELESFNNQRKAAFATKGGRNFEAAATAEQYAAYKSSVYNAMRYGVANLNADELKAMSVGVDTDGGFLMPPSAIGRVVERLYEVSPIRAIATVQTITGDALEGINDLDEASAGWVGETGARTETNTPQVGKYEVVAHEMYAAPKATQKLLDDAAVNIEEWLAGKVSRRFARVEGGAFVVGNGVSKPRGFTQYDTAATADGSRAWGTFEHVVTGVNADFAASNKGDILFDLEGAFKPDYLTNARWVAPRAVITAVRKFKGSDNNYLWQPGLQAGKPAELIGYPITIAQDMPALAAGSLSLALGDFKEGYLIVDRMGIRVLRDPFTNKPFVIFYTTKRTGGGAVNFDAIKFIKFST